MGLTKTIEKKVKKSTVKISVSDSDSSSESSVENEDQHERVLEADVERSDDSDKSCTDVNTLITNEGWADSITKILGSTKPKHKKTLVLSRAKKHLEIIKKEKDETPAFEVIGENTRVKEEITLEEKVDKEPTIKRIKSEKPSIRIKPNVLGKDRERLLSKIATKGVVQLFNAVRNQQRVLAQDIDKSDLTEGKKEKILKKFDKRTFLDTLMGQTKSIVVDKEDNQVKDEEDVPKWNALRDDFMMGAKMKDWDKDSVDE